MLLIKSSYLKSGLSVPYFSIADSYVILSKVVLSEPKNFENILSLNLQIVEKHPLD